MLQQILRDMWVDPDILSELDEGQKQTLFCKMREEQVRRWVLWDKKVSENENPSFMSTKISNKPKKNVNFLVGTDGEPWVWVMGEHPDDKTIEEILEGEAREKARKLVEEVITPTVIQMNEKNTPKEEEFHDSLDIYCSVEELKDRAKIKPLKNINNYTFNTYKSDIYSLNDRDVLQEISLNKVQKVAQKVALWEKKMMEERIFKNIQKKHLEVAKEAEEQEHNQEAVWREQERKAKHAEQQIREIARKAREEHRLAAQQEVSPTHPTSNPPPSPPGSPSSPSSPSSPTTTSSQIIGSCSNTTRPPNRQAVLSWYSGKEVKRGAGVTEGRLEPWFHGLITRQEAENLLMSQENGTFLVRLSERIWGYTITYRAPEKCKHYLIDASNGHYQFLGSNQVNHNTLGDLITYHKRQPLSGGECLVKPCPRSFDSSAFHEILQILDR